MALLERVATLIRANLNDLIDKSENPEKMVKQVLLDMQNQFMQVKTQVAIAIADLHLLEKKRAENDAKHDEWIRMAELAVEKNQDDLARTALDRAMSYEQMSKNFVEQIEDQKSQVELLKNALRDLEKKIAEARTKSELLVTQHRRSRAVARAADAQFSATNADPSATFARLQDEAQRQAAIGEAKTELIGRDVEMRFAALEREDRIDKLLAEIKAKKQLPPAAGQ
ncbi:MAG TPA: PspA/IM30 family protein [candidate division Zixibacteria bacterium]|nr:PspA/IM30 family protein [candidate division Zixibacteria bacterium]